MSSLETPDEVVKFLTEAREALGRAHAAAGETEAGVSGLIGPVRDMVFGLNSSVDALRDMVLEGRFG